MNLLTLASRALSSLVQKAARLIPPEPSPHPARQHDDRIYASLFELSQDAIFMLSPDGVCLNVNPQAARLLGEPDAALRGRALLPLLALNDPLDQERLSAALTAGQSVPATEITLRRRDGSTFPAEVQATLVRDAAGQPAHRQIIVRDISARKQTDAALAQSNRLFRHLVDNLPYFVYALDRDSRFLMANAALARAVSASPDEVVGKTVGDFFPPDLTRRHRADEERILASGQAIVNQQERLVNMDHNEIWALMSKFPVLDDQQQVIGIVGIARDISAFKEREAALQESERFIQKIAQTIPDLLYVYDFAEQRYVYSNNDVIHQLLGYTPDDMARLNIVSLLELIHPDDQQAFVVWQTRFMEATDEDIVETEYRIRHKDGSWHWLVSRDRVFARDEHGKPTRSLGVAQDITARKASEDTLRRQNEYLTALSEIPMALMNRLEPTDLLKAVLVRAAALMGTGDGFIDLILPGATEMVEFATIGRFDNFYYMAQPGEGVAGKVWQTGETIVVNDYASYEGRISLPFLDAVYACVGVPLRSGGEVVGILGLAHMQPGRTFSDEEVSLLNQVAELVSIALDNAHLYTSVQRELAERQRVEAALREGEARYRAVVEDQTELIARFLPDTTLTFVNDAYCRYFGVPREQIIGTSFLSIVPEPDQAEILRHKDTLTRDTPSRTAEHRVQMPNGDIRWFQWSDRAIFNDHGEIVEYQTVGRDITKRRHAEEALQLSEARYRAVVEDQSELICRYLPDNTLTFVNEAYCRYFGRTRESLIGANLLFLIPEEDWAAINETFAPLREGKTREVNYQHRVLTPDGSQRWMQWTDRALYDERGNVVEFQAVGRDIDEQKRAQEALQKERALLRTLVDTLPDRIYVKDHEGRFLLANIGTARAQGVESVEALIGLTDFDCMDYAVAQHFYEDEQEMLRTGIPIINMEVQAIEGDGQLHWVSNTKVPFRSAEGEIVGLVGITRDITHIKQAEAALRVSEENFRQLAENIRQVFWLVTPDLRRMVYISPAYQDVWGLDEDAITHYPDSLFNSIHPDDRARVASAREEQMSSGGYSSEYRIVRPDNTVRWIWSRAFPIYNEHGEVYRIAGISEDITSRKEAEAALVYERDFISAILRTTVALISVVDHEGRFVSFNPACEQFTGYTFEEVQGKAVWDLFLLPDEVERVKAIFTNLQPDQLSNQNVNYWRLRDGSKRLIAWSNTALTDDNGRVSFIISTGIDITTQKELEERNVELAVEREKVKILGSFVRDASHDFRTPLSILNTNLYLMRKTAVNDKQNHRIVEMETQVKRLTELIDQLLTMTRLDSLADVQARQVSVNELVQNIQIAMQNTINRKQIDLTLHLAANLPSIRADSIQLSQALSNLVMNAVQYTPPGGHVSVTTALASDIVTIDIEDTGVGITEEDLPHIFDRFYRADKARSGTVGGAGLGLAITKKIIDLHAGKIEVSSVPGAGSVFRVVLPLDKASNGDHAMPHKM